VVGDRLRVLGADLRRPLALGDLHDRGIAQRGVGAQHQHPRRHLVGLPVGRDAFLAPPRGDERRGAAEQTVGLRHAPRAAPVAGGADRRAEVGDRAVVPPAQVLDLAQPQPRARIPPGGARPFACGLLGPSEISGPAPEVLPRVADVAGLDRPRDGWPVRSRSRRAAHSGHQRSEPVNQRLGRNTGMNETSPTIVPGATTGLG
jgi:hypothetical protein